MVSHFNHKALVPQLYWCQCVKFCNHFVVASQIVTGWSKDLWQSKHIHTWISHHQTAMFVFFICKTALNNFFFANFLYVSCLLFAVHQTEIKMSGCSWSTAGLLRDRGDKAVSGLTSLHDWWKNLFLIMSQNTQNVTSVCECHLKREWLMHLWVKDGGESSVMAEYAVCLKFNGLTSNSWTKRPKTKNKTKINQSTN